MLQITPHMRILVCVEPVNFRNGIDGLVSICKTALGENPLLGAVFVFRNRRSTSVKVLAYDGQGFWVCQKRLSTGKFHWWPSSAQDASRALAAHELQVLLAGGNPESTQAAPQWRPIRAAV